MFNFRGEVQRFFKRTVRTCLGRKRLLKTVAIAGSESRAVSESSWESADCVVRYLHNFRLGGFLRRSSTLQWTIGQFLGD